MPGLKYMPFILGSVFALLMFFIISCNPIIVLNLKLVKSKFSNGLTDDRSGMGLLRSIIKIELGLIITSLSEDEMSELIIPMKIKKSMREDKIIPTTVANKYLKKLFISLFFLC